MRAKVISVSIQKGGTGKTTTAAALAQAAAYMGEKEPQGGCREPLHK